MMITGICPIGDHPFEYEPKQGAHRIYCSIQHQRKAGEAKRIARINALTERRCPKCDALRPVSEFSGPTAPYCKEHMAQRERDNRAANPDPNRSRREGLARYGLTFEEFDARLAEQGGKCAICGSTEPGGVSEGPRGWHVDHDHACCNTRKRSCGKCFRGILCAYCNTGIGNLRDDPEIILAALQYVLAYRARRESGGHINLSAEVDAAVTV